MNERIDELIEQCIDQRWTVTGPLFDREKFAELIVRECADRIRFCIKNDIDFIAEDIEKHFGVDP